MSDTPEDKNEIVPKPKSPSQPVKGPAEIEETAHLDDAVIGRAFRRSMLAAAVIAVVAGGVIWFVNRKPAPKETKVTPITAPSVASRVEREIPVVKFTDVTDAAGIRFVHNNGAYGDKLLPETMGGGVAFFDFDNDGDQDLLFVNSSWWPWRVPAGKKPATAALYRNDGKGHFEDVTAGSGLDVSFYGMGVAIGDYDNDGLPDVFITAVGGNHLFHNEGNGKFAEVTAPAGVCGT